MELKKNYYRLISRLKFFLISSFVFITLQTASFAAGLQQGPTAKPESLQGSGTRSSVGIPTISFGLNQTGNPNEVANAMKIMILLTVLSLAPAILILMTSFTRIVVVLSFLRQAIGTQQMPPNQLVVGLSLFLSFFVMAPTFKTIQSSACEKILAILAPLFLGTSLTNHNAITSSLNCILAMPTFWSR
jgi:flagellar biosynthesis protein FliP